MFLSITSIIYALLGISILVFVHELGHYLAAKRVGVRVERFAVGFDPPVRGKNLRLFAFKRGETEYVLGAVPFGGYVKLAGGEMMLDPDHKPAPDELPGKSVSARSLVFVAGSVMNILFAFGCFMLAFTLGVPFPAPHIGGVDPGTPAWGAGLLAGDKIVAVDGDPTTDFSEVRLAIALASSNQSLRIDVERESDPGKIERLSFPVTPRWEPEQGINVVGIHETLDTTTLEDPNPDSPGARAGLKKGDRVVGFQLGEKRLPRLHYTALAAAIENFQRLRPGTPFGLIVLREGEEKVLLVEPRKNPDQKPMALLGIVTQASLQAGGWIREIHPSSRARSVFRPRDRIVAINGEALPALHWIDFFDRFGPETRLSATIVANDGKERVETFSSGDFLTWSLLGELRWDTPRLRVGELSKDTALERAGLKNGDLLTHLDNRPIYALEDLEKEIKLSTLETISLRVVRDNAPLDLSVGKSELTAASGVTWDTMPEVSSVIRGGPADLVGVVPGSRILRLGTQRLFTWNELLQTVQGLNPGASAELTWRTPQGSELTRDVLVKMDAWEASPCSFSRAEIIVKVSALNSFQAGAKRTWISAKQIFLTLRSLIRRDVSPKNLSGPIGITHLLTVVANRDSWSLLIFWLGLISINLGLFNLLPFPILDGGHLTFLAIEKIKGSPVNIKVQEWAMNVALLAILTLAVFVTFNDIKRLLP